MRDISCLFHVVSANNMLCKLNSTFVAKHVSIQNVVVVLLCNHDVQSQVFVVFELVNVYNLNIGLGLCVLKGTFYSITVESLQLVLFRKADCPEKKSKINKKMGRLMSSETHQQLRFFTNQCCCRYSQLNKYNIFRIIQYWFINFEMGWLILKMYLFTLMFFSKSVGDVRYQGINK